MGRLSIEIPEHQHKQIKALAAWHGLSLKDYIVERTLVAPENAQGNTDVDNLMRFLAPRIETARRGDVSKLAMTAIIAKAKSKRRSR